MRGSVLDNGRGRKVFFNRPLKGFNPLKGFDIGRGILLILTVWCVFYAPATALAEQGKPLKSDTGTAAASGDKDKIANPPKEDLQVNPRYFEDGSTRLHKAALTGKAAGVGVLIKSGLKVDARTKAGQTPLHFAAYQGSKEFVKVLIDNGADVNAKDIYGRTPLHMTAIENRSNIQAAVVLLSKGAYVNAKDNFGYAPLHYAASSKYPDNGELAGYLIEKGADVNARTNRGSTPLHEAAQDGKTSAVRVLIENGADMEAKTGKGNTPLHEAAEWGRVESAALLLEKGADIKAKNMASETPLDVAKRLETDFSQTFDVRSGARGVVNVMEGFGKNPADDGSSVPAGKQGTDGIKPPEEEFLQP